MSHQLPDKPIKKSARWKLAESNGFAWHQWGESYVAFHRPSSTTHLLNESSAYLLQEMLSQPRSIDELVELLIRDPSGRSNDIRVEVQEMLQHFEVLGFVARVQ